MKIRTVMKSAVALLLAGAMGVCFCGCSETKLADNTAEIQVNPGDTLAEMTIQVGEETGKIRFKLFPEVAPMGVKNFVELAQSGYYNGKTIHRVVEDFMIQGGSLRGDGAGGTTHDKMDVPRETNERMRAYYGALGYAEDSTGINSQFFIVNNKNPFDITKTAENVRADLEEYADRLTDEDKAYYSKYVESLNAVPDDVKAKYMQTGGSFSIDGNYTIFGQAIEGFEFIDKISAVEVSAGNKMDDEQGIESKPTVSITIKKIEIATIPVIEETEATTTRRPARPSVTTTATDTQVQTTVADTTVNEETPAPESADNLVSEVTE